MNVDLTKQLYDVVQPPNCVQMTFVRTKDGSLSRDENMAATFRVLTDAFLNETLIYPWDEQTAYVIVDRTLTNGHHDDHLTIVIRQII